MIWHTCPCCGVARRPHRDGCDISDACPEEEADWAEMTELRAEVARLRLTDAERTLIEKLTLPHPDPRMGRSLFVTPDERDIAVALLARLGGGA